VTISLSKTLVHAVSYLSEINHRLVWNKLFLLPCNLISNTVFGKWVPLPQLQNYNSTTFLEERERYTRHMSYFNIVPGRYRCLRSSMALVSQHHLHSVLPILCLSNVAIIITL